VRYYPWVDNYGVHGVWMVKQENRRGEVHLYSKAAMDRLEEAVTKGGWWTFFTEGQGYQSRQYNGDLGKPQFLGTIRDYLERAFPPERRITVADHPVWAKNSILLKTRVFGRPVSVARDNVNGAM